MRSGSQGCPCGEGKVVECGDGGWTNTSKCLTNPAGHRRGLVAALGDGFAVILDYAELLLSPKEWLLNSRSLATEALQCYGRDSSKEADGFESCASDHLRMNYEALFLYLFFFFFF